MGQAWFEEEEFWLRFGPVMFDGARWAEVPAVIDGLDALLRARGKPGIVPGLRVLDACCGPGRHSLELARRGCRVTGVDLTQAYLDAAAESAQAEALEIEFLRADMRTFCRPGGFDLALNLFTSFGYFDGAEEDRAMLRGLRESLAADGALVIELIGKETAARDFVAEEEFDRDGISARSEYRVEGDWDYLVNRWIIEVGGERFERGFRQRLYSARELRGALESAGFAGGVACFGNSAGIPYDAKAWSLLAIAAC